MVALLMSWKDWERLLLLYGFFWLVGMKRQTPKSASNDP